MTFIDFLIAPIILTILVMLTLHWKKKYYAFNPARKYFLSGLWIRILGTVAFAFVYQFYYGGGDTFEYFKGARILSNALLDSPSSGLEILFSFKWENYSNEAYSIATRHRWFFAHQEGIIIRIASVLSLLIFNTYLGIAFVFSFLGYLGTWFLFRVFQRAYPHQHKAIAIATLYIPSVVFWGTGIMKEPICLFGIGLMVLGVDRVFLEKKKKLQGLVAILLGSYLLITIKMYIFLALAPALLVLILFDLRLKLNNKTLQWLSTPVFVSLALIVSFYLIKTASKDSDYDLEVIEYTAESYQSWHERVSEMYGGSGYSLGEVGGNSFSQIPQAIVVTLFRPFPWEAGKLINVPAVFEGLIFLFLTLMILIKSKLLVLAKNILKNPYILFCLIFSISFAYGVGVSSYNFGALVRYKIPCLPFYMMALIMIYDESFVFKGIPALPKLMIGMIDKPRKPPVPVIKTRNTLEPSYSFQLRKLMALQGPLSSNDVATSTASLTNTLNLKFETLFSNKVKSNSASNYAHYADISAPFDSHINKLVKSQKPVFIDNPESLKEKYRDNIISSISNEYVLQMKKDRSYSKLIVFDSTQNDKKTSGLKESSKVPQSKKNEASRYYHWLLFRDSEQYKLPIELLNKKENKDST